MGRVGLVGQVGRIHLQSIYWVRPIFSTAASRLNDPTYQAYLAYQAHPAYQAYPKRRRITSPRYWKIRVSVGATNRRFATRPSGPSGGA